MNAHQLDAGGVIVNTIVVDSLNVFPNLIDASLGGAIGDLWDGKIFSKPPTPPQAIPQSVTMRQARLALLAAGKLAAVNSAIAGMTGPAGDAARIEWEFSGEVKRDQPLVAALGEVLGLSAVQLDGLFVAAAAL